MDRDCSRRRFLSACGGATVGAFATAVGAGGASAADAPPTRWDRTNEQSGDARGNGVAPAVDGGYVVGGSTDTGDGGRDAWLYEVDGTGALVWEETYSAGEETGARDVIATGDGYLLVGYRREGADSTEDAFALRVDADGAKQWGTTFSVGSETDDTFASVTEREEGGYVMAGETSRFNSGLVVAFDGDGNVDWRETFGGSGENRLTGVAPNPDGGYLAVGQADYRDGDVSGWVINLTADGGSRWVNHYRKKSDSATNPRNDYNAFYDVAESRDGFVMVGTTTFERNGRDRDAWAMEINGNGERFWEKTYSQDAVDELRAVAAGESGLVSYVAGRTGADDTWSDARGYALKVGIDGSIKWSTTAGGDGSRFNGVVLTDAKGLVCAGTAPTEGGTGGWTVKIGGEAVATPTPTPTPMPTATATPTPTATATPTPTATEAPTPTPTPPPTSGADSTPTPTERAGTGGDDEGTTVTPTGAPPAGGSDGATGTTAAGNGGSGGLSTTTLGVGLVIAALAGGGFLYNRYFRGGDRGGPAPAGGQGAGPGGDQPPGGRGQQPQGQQPQRQQPQGGQGQQPRGGQGRQPQRQQPQGGQGQQPQGGQGRQPQRQQPQGGQGQQPQGQQPQDGQGQPQGGRPQSAQGQPGDGRTGEGPRPASEVDPNEEVHDAQTIVDRFDEGGSDVDAPGEGADEIGEPGDADEPGDTDDGEPAPGEEGEGQGETESGESDERAE
ncbi:MAG: hypothetical protein ABEJ40_01210 [Haloarculaceae archaeon]